MPLPLPLVHVSLVLVLILASALINHTHSAAVPDVCMALDLDNPLAEKFPNNATGVLNATLAIIPITLEAARRIIPKQFTILEHAYRDIVPDFPKGMYPVMLQAAHDHDVQFRAYGITLDDFSRVGFEFPFLDFFGDGHSSFRWAPSQLISSTNVIALEGSRAYGTVVSPATYDPVCDAYRTLSNGAQYFRGSSLDSPDFIEYEMWRVRPAGFNPYPLELFKNITNQPTFANGSTCDNMIRLFNTSMSTGPYEPVAVRGRVHSLAAPFEGERTWTEVYGVQVATPFIENNYLDCRTMQGYEGTGGPGDSHASSYYNNNDNFRDL
ncbi:hypothetical protein GQ53DRAFT_782574 [Thozetella sp. PMI_491]|nr:hypothetical protein GQ53DRAFT_782574 [Thozetella sp. PMI_491]